MADFTALYEAAFSPVNIVYSIVMIMLSVYWLTVILGVIDLGAFDLDFDLDADVGDVDVDVEGAIPGLNSQWFLSFFNLGEVPIMLYITIMTLVMWVGSVQINNWIQNENIWLAMALAIPNFIFALFVAKFAVIPFKWMKIERPVLDEFAGKICLVTSGEVNDNFGECELREEDGVSIKLMSRTRNGEVLVKGDAATIVEKVRPENIFIVTKYHQEA